MIISWLRDLGFDRRPLPDVGLRRVGAWALEVTVFTVPWQGAVSGGTARLTQIVGIIAIGAALPGLLAGGIRRWPAPAHWMLIGWAALGTASWFWTTSPDATLARIQTLLQLLALALLLWEFGADAGQRRRFMIAFVMGTTVAIGLSLNDYATADATRADFQRFSAGDAANPNDLGASIALALPIIWYLGLTTYSRLRRALLVSLIPVGLLGVILTASRTGLVVAGVGLALAATLTVAELGLKRVVAGLLLAPVILIGLLAAAPDKAVDRLATITEEASGEGNLSNRATLWPAGIQVFTDHPVVGVGLGGSRFAIESLIRREAGAHNSFISIAAELGFGGLFFLVATLLMIGIGLWRQPSLERRMGSVLLAATFLAMLPLHWEYSKTLWIMLSILIGGLETAPLPFSAARPPLVSGLDQRAVQHFQA